LVLRRREQGAAPASYGYDYWKPSVPRIARKAA